MNVGFIGVGNIGAPIAGQLLKAGHALVVYDLRREAANTLLAAGAEWSDSPAALAAECEVVATCLPGPVEMEQVCLGPGGIVGHLKPGVVERTFAWFGRNRRLARDFERTITSSEAWLYLASI